MSPKIAVKICGLKSTLDVVAAADADATYIGLNFFAKSPRSVDFAQAATLAHHTPVGICKVALVVNETDAFLDDLVAQVPLDMLQLHGGESVERVREIKSRYGLPVMKVLGVSEASDLDAIDTFSTVADQLLLDAKAPKGADLPGGNGLTFDWTLLANRKFWAKPWMLAGGLTPANVALAVIKTGTLQVDVASGVETEPGVKDRDLIKQFCDNARSARS